MPTSVSGRGGVNAIPDYSGTSDPMHSGVNVTPDYNAVSSTYRIGQRQPIAQNLQTPPDTVEISAENRIKKKEGLSTGAKVALGIAGTAAAVYGCVVGHRFLAKPTIETVQKNFSEIFRRDISKEEAEKMAGKYKDIFKIKDKDEFAQKAFEQIKKDFGWEHLNIKIDKLSKEDIAKFSKDGIVLGGSYKPLRISLSDAENGLTSVNLDEVVIQYNFNQNKKDIFKTIIHELTHCKQHEIMYRYDKDKLINTVINNRFDDKLKSKLNNVVSEYKKLFNEIYSKEWDKLPRIPAGTKEAQTAEKYLHEIEHYTGAEADYDKYMALIIEKEAHGTADKTKTIYNFFANPWRIL